MSIHRYIGCLHEIEILLFQTIRLIGRNHRLDTNYVLFAVLPLQSKFDDNFTRNYGYDGIVVRNCLRELYKMNPDTGKHQTEL